MTQFVKAGKLEKTYNALRIVLDDQAGGRRPGDKRRHDLLAARWRSQG